MVPERARNQSDFVSSKARVRSVIRAIAALSDIEYDVLLEHLVEKEPPPVATFPLPLQRRPVPTADQRRRAAEIPDFDDPDFEAKLGTGTVDQNKRAVVRIWNNLSDDDRRAFLKRAASPADLRRALV